MHVRALQIKDSHQELLRTVQEISSSRPQQHVHRYPKGCSDRLDEACSEHDKSIASECTRCKT